MNRYKGQELVPVRKLPPADAPAWVGAEQKLDEASFCRAFLQAHPMVCVHGSFFTVEGRVSDEGSLRREIYDRIAPYVVRGMARKVDSLLELLRVEAYVPDLPVKEDRIHVANGTYILPSCHSEQAKRVEESVSLIRRFAPPSPEGEGLRSFAIAQDDMEDGFTEDKEYCRNRLPVRFDPKAPTPTRWLQFLSDLLAPEDILTLQEFMGYCLIPTNRAQKMLMLIGSGGEGKSRIGVVMRAIFGDNMVNGNLSKVETNRFARADLEHMLVMVDDDMKLEALPQTNYIKTIVTADVPVDLEKKSRQSYQGELYCRFLGFGNGNIKALYDRSRGFYRRQIILTTKKRPMDRVDDPHLSNKLIAEKEGIFLWCLNGLQRLIDNSFRFTISRQSQENMQAAVSDGNNIVDFMKSEGYIRLDAKAKISSKQLYGLYGIWCEDNALRPLSQRSFAAWLSENQEEYSLEPTNNIYIGNGRRARGWLGIEGLQ